jgi:hypothetical protein
MIGLEHILNAFLKVWRFRLFQRASGLFRGLSLSLATTMQEQSKNNSKCKKTQTIAYHLHTSVL